MPSKREILTNAAVFLAAVILLFSGLDWLRKSGAEQQSDVIVLRAGHSANVDEPYHLGLQHMARAVERRTQGKVRIEIFPSLQLGSERAMIEGLMLGTLDLVVTANGSATNFVSELGVLDLPYLFDDRVQMYAALDGVLGQDLQTAASNHGLELLAFYDAGVRHLMTRDRLVESHDDLHGLKIRTMPVPAHLASFSAFGANAIAVDYGELYGGLQTGLIDGAEAANTNYSRKKFYEVASNWAQIGWIILVAEVLMSNDALERLSEEQQSIIRAAAQESAIYERELYATSDASLLPELVAMGVTVTHPDPAPFKAAATTVHREFATTDARRHLLELAGKASGDAAVP